MSGIIQGTVVPFRGGKIPYRRSASILKSPAMKKYRVTAFYDYPPVERSVVVEAEGPQRAMVRALLEGKVPALFRKDEFGWLLPVFWHPRFAGVRRWPTVVGSNMIAWGDRGKNDKLMFDVNELKN